MTIDSPMLVGTAFRSALGRRKCSQILNHIQYEIEVGEFIYCLLKNGGVISSRNSIRLWNHGIKATVEPTKP